ncbi:MAG: efflux RND transporter periplasmic adaptor subunit [Paludibacteraceae bacterium]|nr:efflux RND transporter periplasmic adaptor subunit [Paludibacteraceae bacterium]
MNRTIYILISILTALILSSCNGITRKGEKTLEPIAVTVVVVHDTIESAQAQSYSGKLAENQSTMLSFQTGGKLKKVYVSEGQKVKKGQILAEVDNTQANNALKAAEATLKQAKDAYNRLKTVHDSGSISEVKWIEMETKLEQAESTAEMARKNFDDCTLKAPFNGIISGKAMGIGSHLLPSQSFLKLINTDTMLVKIEVPENDISKIKEGQKADVTVLALDNYKVCGKVFSKNVDASDLSHTYEVTIIIPNPDGKLLSGMVCKAEVRSDKSSNNIIIPYESVQLMPDGRYVWCVVNGTSKRKKVETGGFANNGIIVTSGLNDGDSVIVQGRQKVYEDGIVIVQ